MAEETITQDIVKENESTYIPAKGEFVHIYDDDKIIGIKIGDGKTPLNELEAFYNKIINAREEFMKQIINLSNTVDDNYNRTNDHVKAMNKHLDDWVDDVYARNLLLEAKIQRLVISNIISLIIGVCAILLALY